MKKILLLLLFLSAPFIVQAQQNASLTAASSSCTSTSCLSVKVDPNQGGATFTISSNASGNTIQFEASGDGGTTWVALNAIPSNSTTPVTFTTSTGTWQANIAGFSNIRLRMSTLSGGSTTVSITESTASARANGGGGGGGTFPTLNQVLDPTADKTFAMGNHVLTFDGINRLFVGTAPNVPAGFLVGLLAVTGPDPNGVYGEMTLWSPALQIPSVVLQSTNGTLAAPTASSLDQILGEIEWFGTGTGAPPDVGNSSSTIAGYVDDTVGVGIDPGRLSFQTADSTGMLKERMRIDSFGNIGIATAGRPSARLEIQNNSGGASNYALLVDDQTAATSNWAIKTGIGKVELGDAIQADNLTASQCVGTDTNKQLVSNTNCVTPGSGAALPTANKIHSTGNVGAISTATLCASSAANCSAAGQYHIHWDFIETGTACGTPATGGVTFLLTWTDSNATTHSAVSLGMDDASAINAVSQTFHFQSSLAVAWASGDFNISTNGAIVQYATGYTACGVGTGAYQLDAAVTRLQ